MCSDVGTPRFFFESAYFRNISVSQVSLPLLNKHPSAENLASRVFAIHGHSLGKPFS